MSTTPAVYIRDQIVSRIQALYEWKSVRKVPTITTQSDQFPRLGVYLIRENESQDGDANVGVPRYIDDAVIGISIMHTLTDPAVLDGAVDDMIDNIKNTLMQDYTFVSLKDANGDFMLDSIPNISRSYSFPNNGESYVIEGRLQMTFRFNVKYDPIFPNLLRKVMVDVRPNNDPQPIGDPYEIDLNG
ncbi:hypothetical protein [Bradyrhizobium sp. S3.7.6]